MNLLLYYILRKIFVKLDVSEKEIRLEKGLMIKRAAVLPLCAAVRFTVRRTLVMRLFGAKEISVFTLGGKLAFYLPKNAALPFPQAGNSVCVKPRFREVAFGAFIDTRALGGLFVFTAVLRRISAIFGSEYFDRLIDVLTKTAADLERALGFFRITVPKIAVTAAVFALGSWVFAYARKLLRLGRFRVSRNDGMLFVKSGVLTLYEHALVLNSSAAIRCDTLVTTAARRAPLYLRGVMICPCVKRQRLAKTLKVLCKTELSVNWSIPPVCAFFGYIAAPLSRLGVFAALIGAVYYTGHPAMLLKTILFSGAIVEIYSAALYLLYMRRSGVASGEFAAIAARRGLRLYTAVFPKKAVAAQTFTQSLLQRRSGRCGVRVSLVEHHKFTARQLNTDEIGRHILF